MQDLDPRQLEQLLAALKDWCAGEARVKGMALVGSWDQTQRSHAEANADLVLVVDEPAAFGNGSDWMTAIDWSKAGLGDGRWSECDHGLACSRHLKFAGGTEVEVSFVAPAWASTSPVDPSTRRIAGSGIRVLHDPEGLLTRLVTVL